MDSKISQFVAQTGCDSAKAKSLLQGEHISFVLLSSFLYNLYLFACVLLIKPYWPLYLFQ